MPGDKSRPIRWGILGAGEISHDWTVAASTLPKDEHQVLAIAARNVERAQKFAELHKIPKVHASYEALLKDPEIDVVYVGILHTEHFRVGKMILDHGKHVLCEKPLCMNAKETKMLIDYAREKKLFFMEAIWSRFFPAYKKLKEEIANGTIGEVMQVRVEMGLKFPEDNWRRDRELGGGTVLDMGTYTTQFATLCFKGLKPIKVIGGGHLNASGADDSSSATVIFPEGKTATLITHSRVDLPSEALVIGTSGVLKLAYPFWCATKLESPSGTYEFELPKAELKYNFWNSTGLAYQCQEVRRCILLGLTESPEMTHEDSILIAEIKEQIRKQIGVVYPQD